MMTGRRLEGDFWLYAISMSLTGVGLVMVYSASAIYASQKQGDPAYFLKGQVLAVFLGLVGLEFARHIPYQNYRKLALPGLILVNLLLIAVLIPGIGKTANGATRWISIPGISFQPSELAKLGLIIYLSHSLARKRDQVHKFSHGIMPHLIIASFMILLIMKQPDFGTSASLAMILLTLLYVGGIKVGYFLASIVLCIPAAYLAVAYSPYRMERIFAFLDPWKYRYTIGYQITESLISVGSGGWHGVGLGASPQKLHFLPEAHTDFIFSIIANEFGLAGVTILVALYVAFVVRGLYIAVHANEAFGTYLATGISLSLGMQALTNFAVCMGLVPTKGLTLPFISYGKTSLILSLVSVGILLNISIGGVERRDVVRETSGNRKLAVT